MRTSHSTLAALAALAICASAAVAESYLPANPSKAQIENAFRTTRSISRTPPSVPRPTAPKSSTSHSGPKGSSVSVTTKGRAVASGAAVSRPAVETTYVASDAKVADGRVSVQIQFDLNSATLRPDAEKTLDRIAEILNSNEFKDSVYVVEGHTDAYGDESYNRLLSEGRAAAVRNYLAEKHGIDPARLPVRGLGAEQPYDASDPYASVNRRVSFVAQQ